MKLPNDTGNGDSKMNLRDSCRDMQGVSPGNFMLNYIIIYTFPHVSVLWVFSNTLKTYITAITRGVFRPFAAFFAPIVS